MHHARYWCETFSFIFLSSVGCFFMFSLKLQALGSLDRMFDDANASKVGAAGRGKDGCCRQQHHDKLRFGREGWH